MTAELIFAAPFLVVAYVLVRLHVKRSREMRRRAQDKLRALQTQFQAHHAGRKRELDREAALRLESELFAVDEQNVAEPRS